MKIKVNTIRHLGVIFVIWGAVCLNITFRDPYREIGVAESYVLIGLARGAALFGISCGLGLGLIIASFCDFKKKDKHNKKDSEEE